MQITEAFEILAYTLEPEELYLLGTTLNNCPDSTGQWGHMLEYQQLQPDWNIPVCGYCAQFDCNAGSCKMEDCPEAERPRG